MRSICDPDFVYRPHSAERRAAASARMKEVIRRKRAGLLLPRRTDGVWRNPQKMLVEVDRIVPRDIIGRNDIVQEILLSLIEGRYLLSEIKSDRAIARRFKNEFFSRNHEQALSLDMRLNADGMTIADVLQDDAGF